MKNFNKTWRSVAVAAVGVAALACSGPSGAGDPCTSADCETCELEGGGEGCRLPGTTECLPVEQFDCMTPDGQSGCFVKTGDKPADLTEVFLPTTTLPLDLDGDGEQDVNPNDGSPLFELDERFDDRGEWFPDADSFDDFSVVQPVTPACPADGIRTGPTDKFDPETGSSFASIEPSSYCRCEPR